jgi:hypothetical protein
MMKGWSAMTESPHTDDVTATDTYRDQIRKRLNDQRDFQKYLTVWGGVSLLVTIIWALTGMGYFWPMWPILGMGIAAFFQWRVAYGTPPKDITEQDIDAEIERINQQK